MRKLGNDIDAAIRALGGDSPTARINRRAHQVRDRFRRALESVYGEAAAHFLAHTNNVYIMDKDGVLTLIVYVDESIYAADLNAQRELIRLKLLELCGEAVEEFEIYVSRGNYKANHPYLTDSEEESDPPALAVPLDPDEKSFVSDTVSVIADKRLRKAVEDAMTADLEWKKGEKGIPRRKNTK